MKDYLKVYEYVSDNVAGTVEAYSYQGALVKARMLVHRVDENPQIIHVSYLCTK